MSFEKAMTFLAPIEGEISDDPHDRGGRTAWGISERAHPDWPGWELLDAGNRDGAHAGVPDFYRANYWERARCDLLLPPLDHVVFDAAVHSGVHQSTCWLQESVDVTADGKFGPRTYEAVHAAELNEGAHAIALETLFRRMTFMVRGFRQGTFSPDDPLRFLGGFWKRLLLLAVEIGEHGEFRDV